MQLPVLLQHRLMHFPSPEKKRDGFFETAAWRFSVSDVSRETGLHGTPGLSLSFTDAQLFLFVSNICRDVMS